MPDEELFTRHLIGLTTPEEDAELDRYRDQEAAARLRKLLERLGARDINEVSHDPAPPLLIERLEPMGPTVLFGQGGIGKGTVTCGWIKQLLPLGHRVLILDYEDHPEEWARRLHGLAGAIEAGLVTIICPTAPEWNGKFGAIWEHTDDLKAVVDGLAITFVIVDSITFACGAADIAAADTPSKYFRAMAQLGLPSLSVGHVTKFGGAKDTQPFGSIHWHNGARLTWSLAKAELGTALHNRKANNYKWLGRYLVQVEFGKTGLPQDIWERRQDLAVADQIEEAMADGIARTVTEVVELLNSDKPDDEPAVKFDTVEKALNRGCKDTNKRKAQFASLDIDGSTKYTTLVA